MGLPTNYGDAWRLVRVDPKDHTTKITNQETGEIVKLLKQSIWTVVIARNRFRVTTLESDIGNSRSSFNVKTGPDSDVAVARTGKKFICTEDTLTVDNPETGLCVQTQTWMHYGRPVEIDPDDFIG